MYSIIYIKIHIVLFQATVDGGPVAAALFSLIIMSGPGSTISFLTFVVPKPIHILT